ncbi:disulfide isomerase/thiol-disulfide oxidase [mine drainage metagenome]|jgi:thiol:disulfide interchange protein DsbG|uniref:Disulfide isomerase/thiol-disulfide oxidase n=1 Tax=mine drainage metagenome TaxID=410659 RepID=A0A1J5R9X1_9ZZZZ
MNIRLRPPFTRPPGTRPRAGVAVRVATALLAALLIGAPAASAATSPSTAATEVHARQLADGLPDALRVLSASRSGAAHAIYMLWYAGDPHSRALFDWYRQHVADLDAIGVAVYWIPLPTSDADVLDADCLDSIAAFARCNAPGYRADSGDALDRLVANFNAWNAFAAAHGLRGVWAAWPSPRGWTGSANVLAGHDGSVDGAATFGLYLRKLGLGDLHPLLASLHTIAQPGVDGTQRLYVFWDPDCAYCHRDFLTIAANAAAIHAANPTLGIRWVPLGVLRPGSRAKAARALAGYAAMARDERGYDDADESGALSTAPDVAPALAREESENRLAWAALTGGGGTPSYLWTGHGAMRLTPGSPDDVMQFLAGLR